MMEAMRRFGGDDFGPSDDDVAQSLEALRIELELIRQVFAGFDLTPFTSKDVKPLVHLECLSAAAEHIITMNAMLHIESEKGLPKKVDAKTFFLAHVKRLRAADDICQPSNVLSHEELSLSQCYMAVAS